jgi:hypothetical protein
MIFVAGHKVTTDPWAVPLSRGRNLICIHSKKHIKNPPEEFPKKQQQNMESMAVRLGFVRSSFLFLLIFIGFNTRVRERWLCDLDCPKWWKRSSES